MIDSADLDAENGGSEGAGGADKAGGSNIFGPELAERLKKALMGARRSDVIALSGIGDRTITRSLAGKPTRPKTLLALAEATCVSPNWLIHGIGEMRPPSASQTQSQSQSQGHSEEPRREVNLDVLQRLTEQQRTALWSCVVMAHNILQAAKRPLFSVGIAETTLDLFDRMCDANGTHRDRVMALEQGATEIIRVYAEGAPASEGSV